MNGEASKRVEKLLNFPCLEFYRAKAETGRRLRLSHTSVEMANSLLIIVQAIGGPTHSVLSPPPNQM